MTEWYERLLYVQRWNRAATQERLIMMKSTQMCKNTHEWMVSYCWNCGHRTVQFVNMEDWDDMNHFCLICETLRGVDYE